MVEIIIPFKATENSETLEKLYKALDSISLQTSNYHNTLVVVDGEFDTPEFRKEFKEKITEHNSNTYATFVPDSASWHGAGAARQKGLDTVYLYTLPEMDKLHFLFDYVMFLDADDILLPNAVEDLYRAAKKDNYDLVVSPLIIETNQIEKKIMKAEENTTWTHGTIYSTEFLNKNNIRFYEGIRGNEDSAFNLLANTLSRSNRGMIEIPTYLWRYNKDSITRRDPDEFASWATPQYIIGISKAITQLAYADKDFDKNLIYSILQIYYKHQLCFVKGWYSQSIEVTDTIVRMFLEEKVQKLFEDENALRAIGQNLHSADYYNKELIIYPQNFSNWIYNYSQGEIKLGGKDEDFLCLHKW